MPAPRRRDRTRFRSFVLASAIAHVVLGSLLGLASTPFAHPAPAAIQVDLFASLPSARATAKPRVKRSRPLPVPEKPVPPPTRRAKKIVLPRDPSPSPHRLRQRPHREYAYDDALSRLREELGESLVSDTEVEDSESSGAAPAPSRGVALDTETAAWMAATRRHVRAVWITPPEFLERSLVTEVLVDVRPDGSVAGVPEVVLSSGDPFWDDNAIRAILSASPLPRPPEPGAWPLRFTPREQR